MNDDHDRALPVTDVYAIVDRRRRQRARTRAVLAPTAAVAAAGATGLVVLAIQLGAETDPAPAPEVTAAARPTTPPPTPAPPIPTMPGFPYAEPDFVPALVDSLEWYPADERAEITSDAQEIARNWRMDEHLATAVTTKAFLLDVPLRTDDPSGADEMIDRFEAAGYDELDSARLAAIWDIDQRGAEVMGGVVVDVEAG